jgi:anti-sigma regulatory factor (Ser/Thr protein kinase)
MAAYRDTAELLVSELVTNALRHGEGPMIRLTLSCRLGALHCEVEDASSARPAVCRGDNEEGESGRGLLLVEHLAARWGSRLSGRGKTVWFDLVPDLLDSPETVRGSGEVVLRRAA